MFLFYIRYKFRVVKGLVVGGLVGCIGLGVVLILCFVFCDRCDMDLFLGFEYLVLVSYLGVVWLGLWGCL